MARKDDKKGWWLFFLCTRLPRHSSPYALDSLRTRLPTNLSFYALVSLLQKGDSKERWWGRITRKDNDFSPYVLVSLRTCLPTHLFPYTLDSSLSMQSQGIYGYKTYLYFVYLLRNEVIISGVSLDGVEFERSIRRNQTRSFLMQTPALSLVLVRVTGLMTRAHFWNVIS